MSANSRWFQDNIDTTAALSLGVVVFLMSYWLLGIYTDGDQRGYRMAYTLVEGMDIGWAQSLYGRIISGADQLYFLIIWVFSSLGADKSALMALFNAGIAAYLFLLLRRWGLGIASGVAIVLSNYYLWVIFLAAERLKFGILFLILSMLVTHRVSWFLVFAALASLSHISVAFIYIGIWLVCLVGQQTGPPSSDKTKMILMLSAVLLLVLFAFAWPAIYPKLTTYYSPFTTASIVHLIPTVVLLTIVVLQTGWFMQPLLAFFPVLVGIATLGPSRLNMFSVSLFMYFSIVSTRRITVTMTLLILYLLWKTGRFLGNVLEYGHGFP